MLVENFMDMSYWTVPLRNYQNLNKNFKSETLSDSTINFTENAPKANMHIFRFNTPHSILR